VDEAFSEAIHQNRFAFIRRQATGSALRIIELRSPISIRYECVQAAYNGGVFDARRTVDEIKHEIEDDFRIGPGEHW
jgi:hypothetical protein